MLISIEEWEESHQGWDDLAAIVESLGQTRWVYNSVFDWHLSRHIYVAVSDGRPVGFILMIVQYIGDDEKHDRFEVDGKPLTEAKVLAFGVRADLRRHGIGQQLQLHAMDRALNKGCYQFRSRSDGDAIENHALKTSMGFAIHPANRGNDTRSAFFVMPLEIWRRARQ